MEKYCYNSDTNNCTIFGGLYQWDEMMQYNTQQGVQGICPQGWHIPTDEEWKILEGAVDSHYEIGAQIWSLYGLRGYDAGKNLKQQVDGTLMAMAPIWLVFQACRVDTATAMVIFTTFSQHGLWWTSTEGNISSAWNRYFSYNNRES